jgi:hypothetical protein
MTTALRQRAGKEHGSLAPVVLEIGAKRYTGTATDAQILRVHILQKFFCPKDSHFGKSFSKLKFSFFCFVRQEKRSQGLKQRTQCTPGVQEAQSMQGYRHLRHKAKQVY